MIRIMTKRYLQYLSGNNDTIYEVNYFLNTTTNSRSFLISLKTQTLIHLAFSLIQFTIYSSDHAPALYLHLYLDVIIVQ